MTGGLQLTKRGRLKKSIARSQEVLDALPPGTRTHEVVRVAVEVDATRLAALTLVGFPKTTVWLLRVTYIYLVLVTGVVLFVQAANAASGEPKQVPELLAAATLIESTLAVVAFAFAVAFALNSVLKHRRETFVSSVQSGVPVSVALRRVGELGPVAQTIRYLVALVGPFGPKAQVHGGTAQALEPLRLIRLERLRRRARRREERAE